MGITLSVGLFLYDAEHLQYLSLLRLITVSFAVVMLAPSHQASLLLDHIVVLDKG